MHTEKMERWNKHDIPLRVIVTNMDNVVPTHAHDFIELVIFSKGNAIHSIGDDNKEIKYSVMQGDCFVIMPNEKHSFESGKQAVYYNIIFSPSVLESAIDELKQFENWTALFGSNNLTERIKVHLNLYDREIITNFIERLSNELDYCNFGYKLSARTILIEILLVILRNTTKEMVVAKTDFHNTPAVMRVINEMETNSQKHYTLEELAKKANMCISGFTKKFRILTGMSPNEYLISLRIEKAQQLLLNSSTPVYEIAEECGFYDINYFIKVFTKYKNITPAKYRKNKKSKLSLE